MFYLCFKCYNSRKYVHMYGTYEYSQYGGEDEVLDSEDEEDSTSCEGESSKYDNNNASLHEEDDFKEIIFKEEGY